MERFYKRSIFLLFVFCAAVFTGCGSKKAEQETEKRLSIAETLEGMQQQETSGREKDGQRAESGKEMQAEAGIPRETQGQREKTGTAEDSTKENHAAGTTEQQGGQEKEEGRTPQETEGARKGSGQQENRRPEEDGTEGGRTEKESSESGKAETDPSAQGRLVVIDAGHQQKGNSEKEPIGPGAEQTKAKVAGGTSGCVSGLAEYELTLAVALKLQEELENRGYTVQQIRTSHDVDMSNAERAQAANDAGAGAFIRIHANGSEDSSVNGAMTICQTPDNPYNGAFYEKSRKLSDCVLEGLTAQTGCKKQYVWETDSMSGINWCQVPVTIVEMGYMTNPDEDALMASEEYQRKIAAGIADGIDRFWE